MTGIWCGVRMQDRVELHMFPAELRSSACGVRIRGRDEINFIMSRAPSAPDGCVCRACWDEFVKEVLA